MTEPLHPLATDTMTERGALINLIDPNPDLISIRDIAGGLAKINRFTGATRTPYSVAQHSVLVSQIVFFRSGGDTNPLGAVYALLHDAHQYLIGDISSPTHSALKVLGVGEAVEQLKDRLDIAIFARFGLAWPTPHKIRAAIESADLEAFQTEFRDLMAEDVRYDWSPRPINNPVSALPWDKAEELFLAHWHRMTRLAGMKDAA